MRYELYENKKLKVGRAIENLKSISVKDAKAFESDYESVISREKIEDVDSLILSLEELENKISEYDGYFKFVNQVKYLEGSVNDISSKESLDNLVSVSIDVLKFYVDAKDLDIDVEEMCSSIYKVIKKEILINNSSKILNTVKDYDVICYGITEYIKADIDEIRKSVNEVPYLDKINTKISELSMRGISSHLVSYELIDLIVKVNYYREKEDEFKDKLTKIDAGIDKELVNIYSDNLDENLIVRDNTLSHLRSEIKEFPKDLRKRITSLGLSILLFGGIGLAIPKISKNVSMTKLYETTTEIYIPGEEKTDPLVDYQKKRSKEVSKNLEIFGEKKFYRYDYVRVWTYDLTNIVLDSIEEYANIDVDYYNLKGVYNDTTDEYVVDNLSEKRRMTIISQDYNKYQPSLKKLQYFIIMSVSYIVMGVELLFGKRISPLYNLKNLLKLLKENKNNKKKFDETLNLIYEELIELKRYLNNINKFETEYNGIKENIDKDFTLEETQSIEKKLKKSYKLGEKYREIWVRVNE